jgi:3-oxoacyl-[acyl-carrier protein] reductase
MNNLKNKNTFITGATGGLGKSFVQTLAKQGANLFLTATDEEKLSNLVKKGKSLNDEIEVFYQVADLKRETDIENVSISALEKFGTVDILINCAGLFSQNSIENTNNQDFQDAISINLFSPYYFSKIFSEGMKKNSWGRIVNIGSSSSYKGFKNSSIYCLSKHGLSGLSKSLEDELLDYGIRVFDIMPGSIKTPMGALDNKQNYETFIEPEEIANFTIDILKYDTNFRLSDVKIYRKKYE